MKEKNKLIRISSGIWECILAELKPGFDGVSFSGNPVVVNSPYGKAVGFDGENDAIFLTDNPLNGLTSFTIEVIIRPYLNGPEEQRFLHIGEIDGDRLLIETRSTKNGNWYLDTFFLSGQNKMVLINPKLVHTIGPWYNVALTIDKTGQMTNYVNGKMEMSELSDFRPINSGEMSIGVRRNKVSWYKGAIFEVKISPEVLRPASFISL
jgi:hypothetical protein